MRVHTTFRHMNRSIALSQYAKKRVTSEAQRFERRPCHAHITFLTEGKERVAQCHLVGVGAEYTVESSSEDFYTAVDRMANKLSLILRKDKERRAHRHRDSYGLQKTV